MIYAIPMYLYVEANSDQEAAALQKKAEDLLTNPLVKTVLRQSQIPEKGFRVMPPQRTG